MVNRKRIKRLLRNFPENGLKLLLEHPGNVRDLLRILLVALIDRIDFGNMRVDPARFVHRDYRHLEADVVLKAPLLAAEGRAVRRQVIIYVLIEHQSEPDELMAFRVLEYVVLIYRRQLHEFQRRQGSLKGFRFHPVLPVVLYTGTRTWEGVGRVMDLVELGDELATVVPSLQSYFLNVGTVGDEALDQRGGAMGGLLRLMHRRKARRSQFEDALTRAVANLERLPESERARWQDLLSYVQALVYYEREPGEHEAMLDKVTTSIDRVRREEAQEMAKTAAEMYIERGMEQGIKVGQERESIRARQETLREQLEAKFGRVPIKVSRLIEATNKVEQLRVWLKEVATAKRIEDVSFTTGA